MSDIPDPTKMPIAYAINGIKHLVTTLEIGEHLVAGSIRRRAPWVKDIEIVLPAPAKDEPDPLLDKIRATFTIDGYHGAEYEEKFVSQECLLGPPETYKVRRRRPTLERPAGVVVKGANPGFRYCQLRLAGVADPTMFINVDLFRYDQGDGGNRGWIELIRTGPSDFSQKALAQWKRVSGGGWSKDGYPRRPGDIPVPVPTEARAFELLQWAWVEPWDRR